MGNIITDLQQRFRQGNISLQLIYINVGVFLFFALARVVLLLFNIRAELPPYWVEMPADVGQFLMQPWSILTYMFLHADIFHLLFNMLWLYWFGQLFLHSYSSKHLRGLYLFGGITGGLFYLLAYNIFPYFQGLIDSSLLLGASASVLAIVVAAAMGMPEYKLSLLLIGQIRLKYVALIVVLTDLLFVTSNNAGGHIAHLGGALAGWLYASGIKNGRYDATAWINGVCDWIVRLFCPSARPAKKPRMKVSYGERDKDYRYNEEKKKRSDEIDRILDKVKQSGYEGLSSEEKKKLFDASQR